MGFETSAKTSLYLVSIWLNGWMLALYRGPGDKRSRMQTFHDALVLWILSYMITNVTWEIPWALFSRFAFSDMTTLEQVVDKTEYMRENPLHMWWWLLGSFSTIDLRTVNHNSTFFTLELYAFFNVVETYVFYKLNKQRSPMRYLVPVLGTGAPVAFTIMFSFTEIFGGYENMPGGVADTLLALVWTQYQYIVFPIVFGYLGVQMLFEDWKYSYLPNGDSV